MINAYYNTVDFTLYKGDSLELLNHIDTKVDNGTEYAQEMK